jgi:hypothetical protein
MRPSQLPRRRAGRARTHPEVRSRAAADGDAQQACGVRQTWSAWISSDDVVSSLLGEPRQGNASWANTGPVRVR